MRVELSNTVAKSLGATLTAVAGASVQVNTRGAGAATVYSASTGGTTLANPLTTDSAGRIEGWVEQGSYDLVVSGTGFVTYTERFEAVSGVSMVSVESAQALGSGADTVDLVRDKGASITGTGDAGALVQEVIAAHPTGGVNIKLPAGIYNWGTIPRLKSGYTRPVGISFAPGSKVILTAAANRLFDFERIGNGYSDATFRDITIDGGGCVVDAGNLAGLNHVIVGTTGGFLSVNYHPGYNFERIRVKDFRLINVRHDPTGVSNRIGVYIMTTNNSTDPLSTVKHIHVSGIRMEGGDQCVAIVSTLPSGQPYVNYFFDHLLIEGCWHDTGVAYDGSLVYPGSNYFLIGRGRGGSNIAIRNCYGAGAGDICLEIDAVERALVENMVWENGGCFYHENQHPMDGKDQLITLRNCKYIRSANTTQARAPYLVSANASYGAGKVKLQGCKYLHRIANPPSIPAVSTYGCPLLDLDDFEYVADQLNYLLGSAISSAHSAISVQAVTGQFVDLIARDVRFKIAGTQQAGSAQWNLNLFTAIGGSGTTVVWDLDTIKVDFNLAGALGASTFRGMFFQTGAQYGTVRKYRWQRMTDLNARTFTINPTSQATVPSPRKIRFEDCDFPLAGGAPNMVVSGTAGTDSNHHNVELRGVRLGSLGQTAAPAAVTPGASPWIYRNYDMYCETLLISGGTVSLVEVSRDGTTYYPVANATNASVYLESGWYARVTYSAVPTVSKMLQVG